jgi:hypothetical protein
MYHHAMSAFRDEHTALLERVARLEEELADARRRGADSSTIMRELDELAVRVSEATERARADRDALAEISTAIERMRNAVAPEKRAPEPAAAPTPEPAAARSSEASRAAWVVGAVVVVAAIAIYFASRGPAPAAVEPVPDTYDPSAELARARASALDAGLPSNGTLVSIKIDYATSDGLIHVHDTHYEARAELEFASPPAPVIPPDPSAPLGAPRHDPGRSFDFDRSFVTVTLDHNGVTALKNAFGGAIGSDPIPDPHCTVAQVWSAAIAAGAPPSAVASLTYEQRFAGTTLARAPRWHFTIRSTSFEYDVSEPDCRVVR